MTKQELFYLLKLKGYEEKHIFEKFMNIIINYNDYYYNPFRNDKKPSCRFSIRPDNRLVFCDWSKKEYYDCFDIVKTKYKVSYQKSIEIIANDFGIKNYLTIRLLTNLYKTTNNNNKITLPFSIRIKKRNFTKSELKWWSKGDLVITQKILSDNNIYSLDCFWQYLKNDIIYIDNLTFHFGYYFGNYKYQIYCPKNKRKFINSAGITYGDVHLLNDKANHLVICKSKKDAFYLRMFGINTMFIINELIILNEAIIKIHNYKYVFTYFDNDKTGLHLSWIYRKLFKTIPLINYITDGKDFTEMLEIYKKEKIEEIIENIKNNYEID